MPVNAPLPLEVRVEACGCPGAVRRRHWPRLRAVVRIQDRWRIDDEWWRESPIARLYYTVLLDNDRDGCTLLTIYHDLVADSWFEQRDHGPRSVP